MDDVGEMQYMYNNCKLSYGAIEKKPNGHKALWVANDIHEKEISRLRSLIYCGL